MSTPRSTGFVGRRHLHRALALVVLVFGTVFAPGMATAAQAASSGTWRYYGTGSSPLTSAWHCGPTDNLPAPYYVSMQACVVKQSGSAQVAMVVNARANNNVSMASSNMTETSSRIVTWDCGAKTFSWGFSVCFGSSISYSGTVGNTSILIQSGSYGLVSQVSA